MDRKLLQIKSFVDNLNDSVFLFSLDGLAIYFNEEGRNLVGFSPNDDISKVRVEHLFNQTTRECLTEAGLAILRQKGKWNAELQVENLFTQECIDVETNLFFVDNIETNQPVYICMVLKDIRGQKETEQLIFEENQILDAFMDNAPDHIYIKDRRCRFLRVNKALARWFGHKNPEEIVGKWDFDFFEEHAMQAYADEIEIMETGEAKKNIIEVETWPHKEDTWVRTSKIPLFNSDNECVGLIGISSDITELVTAEKKVKAAHKQTERILASISSILIAIGPNEEITQWNTAAAQAFGIKEEDVIGKKFLNTGIKWDWPAVLEQIARSLENKKLMLHDIKYIKPDGAEGFLDILINRITDDHDEHSGYLLIANEITERRHLESQLSHAQKLESIGQLAAGIAHEINTPIQYVGDNVHFLKEAFERVSDVLAKCYDFLKAYKDGMVNPEHVGSLESAIDDNQIDYIMEEIPSAIQET